MSKIVMLMKVGAGVFFLGVIAVELSTASASNALIKDLDCVIQPSIVAELGVGVPGLIHTTNFIRSDYVSKGAVLAELESDIEKASLQLAMKLTKVTSALDLRRINASFGDRTLERHKILYKDKAVSRQILDQVETESSIARMQVMQEHENAEIAKIELARALATLDRRIIRSPFDGVITEQYKTAGEYVADDPIFQIAKLDPLRVEVVVPLALMNSIEPGMVANVTSVIPDMVGQEYLAVVKRVDPVADAASGTYGVWLELANPDLTIPSGVRCQLDFVVQDS